MAALEHGVGTLALIGGDEWGEGGRELDAELIAGAGAREVVVLPTAAAFEHPERVAERARRHFEQLGVEARILMVLHRTEAEDLELVEPVRRARLVYLSDGSPLHSRSVLKDSALWEAVLAAYHGGGTLAASGASATLVCDPMVDPRGGAYTVGLGLLRDLAVFPYHGTAAGHLRERSIDLLPSSATLVGIDEHTALVRSPAGEWRVAGPGGVTLYRGGSGEGTVYGAGAVLDSLP